MRDANIITLYKNKGGRSDCNSYRGISLLSTMEKAFARVVLKRLPTLKRLRVYPEAQCGYRARRLPGDLIFSPKQLQEKCLEQRRPSYIAFIYLTKAFDLVSRGLLTLLRRTGYPPKFLRMLSMTTCKAQSTPAALRQTLSQSKAGRSKDVYFADTFQHLFLTAVPRLQLIRRWYLPPHQNRRKPFQPQTTPRQDQATPGVDHRDALRR